jgi:hypothetical protein
MFLRAETGHSIAQAAAPGQLPRKHGDKLRPAEKRTEFLPNMVLLHQGLKFMSRENSYNLGRNGATMSHGSDLPVITRVLEN